MQAHESAEAGARWTHAAVLVCTCVGVLAEAKDLETVGGTEKCPEQPVPAVRPPSQLMTSC